MTGELKDEKQVSVGIYLTFFILAVVVGIAVDWALGICFGLFGFFVYALTEG